MRAFESVSWNEVFVPSVPLLEIFIRGTFGNFGIFLLLRLVLKREAGNLAMNDLLVVVLIADAAQNAMTADYKSVPDGDRSCVDNRLLELCSRLAGVSRQVVRPLHSSACLRVNPKRANQPSGEIFGKNSSRLRN